MLMVAQVLASCIILYRQPLAGQMRTFCPPEDVGGTDGYHDFLEAVLVAPHSEEAQQMRDWAGGDFDPQRFDKRLANAAIYRMMYNKWGGK
jgi:hypothetical protein